MDFVRIELRNYSFRPFLYHPLSCWPNPSQNCRGVHHLPSSYSAHICLFPVAIQIDEHRGHPQKGRDPHFLLCSDRHLVFFCHIPNTSFFREPVQCGYPWNPGPHSRSNSFYAIDKTYSVYLR